MKKPTGHPTQSPLIAALPRALHNAAAWLRLAVLYGHAGKIEESASAFRRAEDSYRADNNLEGLIETTFQHGADANRRGQYAEAEGYLQKALQTARLAGNLQQEVNITLMLASTSYATGDAGAADRYAREALETAQANQIEVLAIAGLVAVGNASLRRRQFADAAKYYEDGLTLARRTGSFRQTAYCLLSLAALHDQMKRSADMLHEAEEARSFFQPNGYLYETYLCLTLIGRYKRDHGDLTGALAAFQESAQSAGRAHNMGGVIQANASVASVLTTQERFPEAAEIYRKNLDSAPTGETKGYAGLQYGNVLWQLGRFDEAQQAFAIADSVAAKFETLRLKLARSRAEMALCAGRTSEAAAAARAMLAKLSPDDVQAVADLKRILALSELTSADKRPAIRHGREALGAAETAGDASTLLSARLCWQRVLLESGDRAGALKVFRSLQPVNDLPPESRWRALALAAGADLSYLPAARQAFQDLAARWGAAAWSGYLKRADVQNLARPLL